MNDIMKIFHDVSPYEGLDINLHPADLQGWGSHDPLFEEVISKTKPKVIVEVGTWKGASAIHMAKLGRAHNPDCTIICIDTWLGSHVMFRPDPGQEDRRASLRLLHGYPQLYFTFLANVVREGLQDCIVPLPTTSAHGAILLRKVGLQADLVHIDAAHEYEAVMADLRAYWPVLSDRGVLLGDDYTHPAVGRAAVDFAKENKKRVVGNHYKFILTKHRDTRAKVVLEGVP